MERIEAIKKVARERLRKANARPEGGSVRIQPEDHQGLPRQFRAVIQGDLVSRQPHRPV